MVISGGVNHASVLWFEVNIRHIALACCVSRERAAKWNGAELSTRASAIRYYQSEQWGTAHSLLTK